RSRVTLSRLFNGYTRLSRRRCASGAADDALQGGQLFLAQDSRSAAAVDREVQAMKSCSIFFAAGTCALTLTLTLALSAVTSAQPVAEPPLSPDSWETPRTPAGKPDFSGFWSQPQHVEPRAGGGATTFTKEKMPEFVP